MQIPLLKGSGNLERLMQKEGPEGGCINADGRCTDLRTTAFVDIHRSQSSSIPALPKPRETPGLLLSLQSSAFAMAGRKHYNNAVYPGCRSRRHPHRHQYNVPGTLVMKRCPTLSGYNSPLMMR